jgi:FkbM family methyltransferase
MWIINLILRAVLDCAYLLRSGHAWRNKIRIILAYVRLTILLILKAPFAETYSDRIFSYRVRHFGRASFHFLFREVFVRSDYFFVAETDRPIVFDCGANIGLATLFFKWIAPDCELHAFEPDPDVFQALKDNVLSNGLSDVHLHNVALCDRAATVDFFVPVSGRGSPLMSLVPGRIPEDQVRRVVVNGEPLSSYIGTKDVDFLKIDVEGSEEAVIRDLVATGSVHRVREMVVEYHHNLQGRAGGLSAFLQMLQNASFHYQLDAICVGGAGAASGFQDILIRARGVSAPIPCAIAATSDVREAIA